MNNLQGQRGFIKHLSHAPPPTIPPTNTLLVVFTHSVFLPLPVSASLSRTFSYMLEMEAGTSLNLQPSCRDQPHGTGLSRVLTAGPLIRAIQTVLPSVT